MRSTFKIFSVLACLAALSACGGGSTGGSDTGQAKVSVTDAPVDGVQRVVFTFDSIDVKPDNGSQIRFAVTPPKTINLLEFTDGQAVVVLPPVDLPAGDYQWLRLNVVENESFVMRDDGGLEPIKLPSEKLKLIRGFTVPEDGLVALTVDFDLRKALVDPPGQDGYILKPVVRVVDEDEVGKITGTVASSLVTASGCSPTSAVYVFSGSGVTPDDFDDAAPEALVSAKVNQLTDGSYRYTAAFLPAGAYTVAFTCQAENDDPALNDAIVFSSTANATVTAGQTTTLNLPPAP